MLNHAIFLLLAAAALHLLIFFWLWSFRRTAQSRVFLWGLLLATLLLACRALFPAWLALETGLYDFTDAVLSFAAAMALMLSALGFRPEFHRAR